MMGQDEIDAAKQNQTEKPADASAAAQEPNPELRPPQFQRRPPWKSTLAAMSYVQKISKNEDITIRNTDRITSILLLTSSIMAILSMVVAPLADVRPLAISLCDVFFGVSLAIYVTNRFGILTALSPRQALITWELVVAAGFVGTYLTLNFGTIIAIYFAHATH
jgi:hypothetical protein